MNREPSLPLFEWKPPRGSAVVFAFPPARQRARVEEYAVKLAGGRRNAGRCLSAVKTHIRKELREAGIAEPLIEREVLRFDQAVRCRATELWAQATRARGPRHG